MTSCATIRVWSSLPPEPLTVVPETQTSMVSALAMTHWLSISTFSFNRKSANRPVKSERRHSGRKAFVELADDLLAAVAEGTQERVVALEQPPLVVEREVHRRRIVVEVAVPVLQLLELAIDVAELLVDLRELTGPQPEFARSARILAVTSVI